MEKQQCMKICKSCGRWGLYDIDTIVCGARAIESASKHGDGWCGGRVFDPDRGIGWMGEKDLPDN